MLGPEGLRGKETRFPTKSEAATVFAPTVCARTHCPYASRGLYQLAAEPDQHPHPALQCSDIVWVDQLSQWRKTSLYYVPASHLCSCFLPNLVHTHYDVVSVIWRLTSGNILEVDTPKWKCPSTSHLHCNLPVSVPHWSRLTLPTPSPYSFTLFLCLKF